MSLHTAERTATDVSALLDLERFIGWLASFGPRAIVGERSDCSRCVVARYLAEHGVPDPNVGEDVILWRCQDVPFAWDRVDTPAWVAAYIEQVDRDDACGPIRAGGPLDGAVA